MHEYDHRHYSFERKLNAHLHVEPEYSDYAIAAFEWGVRGAIFVLGALVLWMVMA